MWMKFSALWGSIYVSFIIIIITIKQLCATHRARRFTFLIFFNTHKHLVRTISFIVLPNSSFACKPKRLTLDNTHTYKKCRNQDDSSDQHSRYTMLLLLGWIKSNHFFILLSLCSRETPVSYTWIFSHNLPKEGIDTLINIPIKTNHNGEQVIL